jgi:patatin-like phospholipase/acyl hydrolase
MSKYLIVAFDGGGIRGYISSTVLQQLIETTQAKNFLPQVSMFAGTSTGSFIALALASNVPIDTIQLKYQQSSAQQIFTANPAIQSATAVAAKARLAACAAQAADASFGSIWGDLMKYLDYIIYASYTNTGVKGVAQDLLGKDTKLSDIKTPVVVNTLQLDDTSPAPTGWQPTVLSNVVGSYSSMLAFEAALCSGAAPIYFPPFSPTTADLGFCADGGLFANNPSLSGIVAALGLNISPSDIYLLSFDTGTTTDSMSASVINGNWGGPLNMGPLQWLFPATQGSGSDQTPKFPLLSALMDASSLSIANTAQAILPANNYMRVTVPLTIAVALDDTSTAAYSTMDTALKAYYKSTNYTDVQNWLTGNFPVQS